MASLALCAETLTSFGTRRQGQHWERLRLALRYVRRKLAVLSTGIQFCSEIRNTPSSILNDCRVLDQTNWQQAGRISDHDLTYNPVGDCLKLSILGGNRCPCPKFRATCRYLCQCQGELFKPKQISASRLSDRKSSSGCSGFAEL